jgi:preprotein translocase subunit SecE
MAETAIQSTTIASGASERGLKNKTVGFFNDVAREMRKVSWPKRDELQDATVITLVVCLVMAAFVFGVDKIFETILKFVYHF